MIELMVQTAWGAPTLSGMRVPKPWQLPTEPIRRDLLLAGNVTHAMLETQLQAGRLLRVRPRVYLDAVRWPTAPDDQHLVRAHAELAAFPDAVISHGSAGLIWGLFQPFFSDWAADKPSVILPATGRYRSSYGYARHRVADLPQHHITRDPDGYAVTSLARTAIDLAEQLDPPQALIVLNSAARRLIEGMVVQARRREYANPRLRQAAIHSLAAVATECRAGRRTVKTLEWVEPRCESPTESASLAHMHLEGLPIPHCQYRVVINGQVFYLDFYWEDVGLIGEVDGASKYVTGDVTIGEKEREQLLRDTDSDMVRWLGKEIAGRPREVMDRIRRARARAAFRLPRR